MANFLAFKTDKLGVEEVTGLVSAPSCGANSIFVGTTRDNFNGKTVTNLEYEAYDSMGIKAMETICLDMRKKWPEVVNIVIHHRGREPEFSCARIDAIVVKRKDSNSHLQVEKVLNSYQYRDQKTFDYLKRYIPSNGIDERLQSLESQLSMDKAVPKNVYQRIKHLEDRLLHLESLSPEYLQFWDKTSVMSTKSMKKRTFELSEIDELTAEVERKCPKAC
ncbi:hypothetical protein D910_02292 [Dendroctonus ponderosae]|uniref:Uncharacterized protein n=1 Tax=Dendroctonus ponderosae TaxID=77166 RepID=U4TTN2_DENPD|nr:hypothetical protein D910_02292 [Dendroctonus ponderosae]